MDYETSLQKYGVLKQLYISRIDLQVLPTLLEFIMVSQLSWILNPLQTYRKRNGFQIIIKGVLFGNLLGLGFYFSQKYFEWIKLDPTTYYVNVAPVELNFFEWFYINLSLIFVCLLLLWFPTKIISSMSPSKNIRKR